MNRGGKIVTPLRDAMSVEDIDGVVFKCDDVKAAEQTRVSSIIAKNRNGMNFRTHVDKNQNTLVVYKPDVDVFDEGCNYLFEDLRDKNTD